MLTKRARKVAEAILNGQTVDLSDWPVEEARAVLELVVREWEAAVARGRKALETMEREVSRMEWHVTVARQEIEKLRPQVDLAEAALADAWAALQAIGSAAGHRGKGGHVGEGAEHRASGSGQAH